MWRFPEGGTTSAEWRVYGKDTGACRLDRSEPPRWLRKKVVVGPGAGALVIREDVVAEVVAQANVKVQGACRASRPHRRCPGASCRAGPTGEYCFGA